MFDTTDRHHRAAILHLVAAMHWQIAPKDYSAVLDVPIMSSLNASEASEHAGVPTEDIAYDDPEAIIAMHLQFAKDHAR